MFEALETGKQLEHKDFKRLREQLRPALLSAQFDLVQRDYPVIIVVAGLDGSGKGQVIHRLNSWMDPRLIDTNAFWHPSDEETQRPWFWRFWRRMPPKATIGIMLGAWYEEPMYQAMAGEIDDAALAAWMSEVHGFERMLCEDGVLMIKLWLHTSRSAQRTRLAEEVPRRRHDPRVPGDVEDWWKRYPRALDVAEQVLRLSDASFAPWHMIEADDSNYRDISCAEIVLRALQQHAARTDSARSHEEATEQDSSEEEDDAGVGRVEPFQLDVAQPTILDAVDLSQSLPRKDYKKRLQKLQARLGELSWQAHRQQRSLVAVFEGWDAAGKGSAIRRLTASIDPRLYKLFQFAAPTDEERAQHYLWRFWRQLQPDGQATLYDRSWYGRVLVERVEGLASYAEWRRAYNEINLFESQLVEHGCVVVKFFIHISKDEQLQRFRDREEQSHKRHKISDEDWRNRARWNEYELAVEDMVANTSTSHAPWTLVAGNCKQHARIQILDTTCASLEAALGKDKH